MRIFEIENANLVWARLQGLDLDIDAKYKTTVDLLNTLIRLKSSTRNALWAHTLDGYENDISAVLSDDFPDSNDPDIIKLKVKATKMLTEINKLKQQLA